MRVGPGEGLQIFVVEARALAQLAIPRLELFARLAADDLLGACADFAHLLVIGILEGGHDAFGGALFGRHVDHLRTDALAEIGPAIIDQIFGRKADAEIGDEVFLPRLLPAGAGDAVEPVALQRAVVALVDRGRRALEDIEFPRIARDIGHHLYRGRAGADHGHTLVRQPGHRFAFGRAAGIAIVPPAGVEALAFEQLDPGQAGQLGDMQRAGAHADIFGGERVPAIGSHDPQLARLVPCEVGHLRVEQRIVVEVVLPTDIAAMVADFGGMRVFLARHVPGFLEQRHVDHACGVALRARVAIPVPGAAEIAAFLDDAIVGDPGFLQPRAHDQPGKPAADKGEGHMIGYRVALLAQGVRIRGKIGEPAFEPDILRGAIGAQALVAFLGIFAPQRLRIDRRSGPCLSHVPLPVAPVLIRNLSIMSRDGCRCKCIARWASARGILPRPRDRLVCAPPRTSGEPF